MNVFDENGMPLDSWDPSRGWLEAVTRTVRREAVEGTPEQGHFETLREYPNGGRDVRWVVDVPGIPGQEAREEEVTLLIYHPYPEGELEDQEIARDPAAASLSRRVAELEDALVELAALIGGDRP